MTTKMENYGRLRKNAFKEHNSMDKFVREFSEKKNDGEFLRAQDMLAADPSLNFSKLSLRRKPTKLAPIFDKQSWSSGKRKHPSSSNQFGGIEYLPVPSPKRVAVEKDERVTLEPKMESRKKSGRDLVAIGGGVPFVLKTFKLYPDLKVLYEVFGNIMKIYKGKVRLEQVILMRNETGPVLQGFYFDFTNTLEDYNPATSIRCIGQFTTQNRFHIHKIEKVSAVPPEEVLTRIQNVSTFALMQSHNGNPK